jgi:hypothetical protein
MKPTKFVAATILCMALWPASVQAAECSISYYQSIVSQANRLKGPLARCDAVVNRRSTTVQQMCRVCGPMFGKLLQLERNVRRHRSCFAGDAGMRRSLAEFASMRYNLQFLRRGCGY